MKSIKQILTKNKVLWVVDDNDANHPLLSGGKHSDTYINCAKVMENTGLVRMLLSNIPEDTLRHLTYKCNTICGIQTGGMALAYIIPYVFPFMDTLSVVYANKHDSNRISRWNVEDINKPILIVDDVISVGSNISKLVSWYDADLFYNTILCLFNLTGDDHINIKGKDFGIVSAFNLKVNRWFEDECPLCRKGSIPVKPKKQQGFSDVQ